MFNSLTPVNLVAPRHAVVLCAAAAEAAGLRARGLRGNRGGAVKRASQQGAPTNGHNAIVPFAHSWAPCALSGSSPRVREAVRLALLGPPGIWIRPARKWMTKYLRISYGTLTGNAPSADLQVLGTTALQMHRHHHRYRCMSQSFMKLRVFPPTRTHWIIVDNIAMELTWLLVGRAAGCVSDRGAPFSPAMRVPMRGCCGYEGPAAQVMPSQPQPCILQQSGR